MYGKGERPGDDNAGDVGSLARNALCLFFNSMLFSKRALYVALVTFNSVAMSRLRLSIDQIGSYLAPDL